MGEMLHWEHPAAGNSRRHLVDMTIVTSHARAISPASKKLSVMRRTTSGIRWRIIRKFKAHQRVESVVKLFMGNINVQDM